MNAALIEPGCVGSRRTDSDCSQADAHQACGHLENFEHDNCPRIRVLWPKRPTA